MINMNGKTKLMSIVEKARIRARRLHEGQKDKYGNPYFEHLERVAKRVREMEYDFIDDTSDIELYVATAYLHDAVEDTDAEIDDLHSFGPEVSTGVHLLTRPKGVKYADYIDQIISPPKYEDICPQTHVGVKIARVVPKIARVVKLADILDHLQGPTPCPPELIKRYEKSLYRLITKAGY
jgi:(p)ppGpp synthase/HD superfamily hydrolase